ncbi:ABC transporter substrate-binding protein [Variovorax paradoxus]|uniref:ABC transporter substrate-binding protein n=1 Tax=Variovorax paradoxus TaxID=34073 RepID=UPI000361F570|nr:ABC transporter substrate-binding protein [Variovorax paradoxus]
MLKMLKASLLVATSLMLAISSAATRAETIEVGVYPTNPPFEAKLPDGSFEGFEVDLIKAVAAKLGADVKFTDLGFQGLFAGLASGRIDVAITAVAITPARLKNQDFTQPYVDTALVLAGGPATSLRKLGDIRGKTIGGIASTTGEAWLRENRDRFGVAEIKSYDTKENLFLDTFNGRIDGAVHDLNAVRYAMTKMKGLQVVERFPSTAQLGMMLKKDSPLTPRLNAAIGELKKDGTLAALWRKWLGSEPDAGSSTVTVLPLPRAQ